MNESPSHRCWAEIDLGALRHNARVAHERLGPDTALLAVVKANGYGHGLTAVAVALQHEAQLFGVANLEEAIEARAAVPQPIIILGPALASERAEIVERGFIASVSSYAEARAFSTAVSGRTANVACVIDTGMGRMGIAQTDAIEELRDIAALPGLTIHSVSSHLPVADEDAVYTSEQLRRFAKIISEIRTVVPGNYLIHALPSAGLFAFSDSAYDIARAGLMLYGVSSLAEFQPLLIPAMTLKTRVALIREIEAGASVSYGRTFIAQRRTRVATLSIGYADGFSRALSNRGAVLIGGRRCPVIGRVTMDLIMADVTEVPSVAEGDEAVVIGRQHGEQILASEVAKQANTIAWEIFTGIGSRVARVYV